jgi:nitroimidazol reductase NimA-like FMN-containing flavoprotein (pyridoxamine 5'-phosphate oxidase superfamily)
MANQDPAAEVLTPEQAAAIPWADALGRLSDSRFYWLATTGPDSAPHVRPVLAVWFDGALHSTSSPTAVKARNLARNPNCSVTVRTDDLDLVLEGRAAKVTDEPTLRQVGHGYREKYEWPVTVRDGAFDAAYGAPTAGPPPYELYRIDPGVVFGFGTDDALGPRTTRWRF